MIKKSFGVKDREFIRGDVPMTKEEVRVISLSKLNLDHNDTVLDIGAGTGSISIECARVLDGDVYAIERNPDAIKLLYLNKEKFKVTNYHIIEGVAPDHLPDVDVNKVIIGGTGGKMAQIIKSLDRYDLKNIVINTITIENTYKALELLKLHHYNDIEVTTVNISKSKMVGPVTMMMGNNPINIITGAK